MASQPTNAGIITDASGVRHIPESTRADGSTRRAIKIRPGYQPPEDVALYKNRTAENFRNRYKGGVPGAEPKDDSAASAVSPAPAAPSSSSSVPGSTAAPSAAAAASSAAANKNAKRREARKRAAATANSGGEAAPGPAAASSPAADTTSAGATPADADAEREKKARGLKKKLKQAKELKNKRDGGEMLLPEQIAKVIRINELVRELAALGFDAEADGGEDKTT